MNAPRLKQLALLLILCGSPAFAQTKSFTPVEGESNSASLR